MYINIYFCRDNINTDIYGANLYNKFIKYGKNLDYKEFAISDYMWTILQKQQQKCLQIKKCLSVLVETGVHHSNSSIFSHHSHRDFALNEDELYRPIIVEKNVCRAINSILKSEGL